MLLRVLDEEIAKIKQTLGPKYADSKFELAKARFAATLDVNTFVDFLTLICYDDVVTAEPIRSTL